MFIKGGREVVTIKQNKQKVQSINVNVSVITVIQEIERKKNLQLCKSIIYFLSFLTKKSL